MILVYEILKPTDNAIGVQLYGMEIEMGRPMRGTRYPGHPEGLLKNGMPGLSLKPVDRKILMNLMMLDSRNETRIRVRGRDAHRLLELICETGRAYSWDNPNTPIRRALETAPAVPEWEADGADLRPAFRLPEGHVLLPAKPPMSLHLDSSF